MQLAKAPACNGSERFGHESPAPEGAAYPVAYLAFVAALGQIGIAAELYLDRARSLAEFLGNYGVDLGLASENIDNPSAFLYAFMRQPARGRPDPFIACVTE